MSRETLALAQRVVVTHHGFGVFLHRIHAVFHRHVAGHLPVLVVIRLGLGGKRRLTTCDEGICHISRKLDESPRLMLAAKPIIHGLGAGYRDTLSLHYAVFTSATMPLARSSEHSSVNSA